MTDSPEPRNEASSVGTEVTVTDVPDVPDVTEAAARPLLRVVKGDPTPEELAALVAVLAARGSSGPAPEVAPLSHWNSPASRLRRPLHAGPGAWLGSSLPQ